LSVAFRRDSDEEVLEPKFELPIPLGPNLVTARGKQQIESQVEQLEALVARELDEKRLTDAKRELRYWRNRLATAQLAPPPPVDRIAFGSQVTFRLNGKERTILIVGDDEADPAHGYVAFSAPLAKAMMGSAAGDAVDFSGKEEAIDVMQVSAPTV
jgi:transcription elongation GreA/GreB family factor